MDQLNAHLDRGWDLAQKGDTHGAGESARRAIALAPDSAEAHNLLGFVASLDGDCEEAVEAYQQAILLDDTFVEAMLSAAELLVHPVGDFDEALLMCERVLDISDFDDEILDAQLLKFEALWAKGKLDEATALLGRLPRGPFEKSGHNFLAGRAYFEGGQLDHAKVLLRAALELDPTHAEAHYYDGLIAEREERQHDANSAFLRVRQLELHAGIPPWAPDEKTFMAITRRAVDSLPKELRDPVLAAELFVVDLPGAEVIVDGVDVHALVLAEATPSPHAIGDASHAGHDHAGHDHAGHDHAGHDHGGGAPRWRLFLYALNVLRVAGSLDAVEEHIRDALEHEIGLAMADLARHQQSRA